MAERTLEELEQLKAEELKLEEVRTNRQEAYSQEQTNLIQQQNEQTEEKDLTFGDYVGEIPKALLAGGRDTVASLITLPEQIIDWFSGDMSREHKEEGGYDPSWDDWLMPEDDPLETKTWWGGLIRNFTHIGTTLAIPLPKLGLLKKGMKVIPGLRKTTALARLGRIKAGKVMVVPRFLKVARKGPFKSGRTLAKSALDGVKFDLVSQTSLEDNLTGMFRENIPQLLEPIATKDLEHPMMKRFKNVAEGIFLGPLVESVFGVVGAGATYIKRSVTGNEIKDVKGTFDQIYNNEFADSITDQNVEVGIKQLDEPGMGAYKNERIATRQQGNSTSIDSLESVSDGMERMEKEWGTEEGSPGSFLSRTQTYGTMKTSGESREIVEGVLKKSVSEKYLPLMAQTAERQGIPKDVFLARHAAFAKEVYEGRMTSDLTPEEFWKSVTDNRLIGEGDLKYNFTHPRMAHAIDLINGALLGEIRGLGIAGRELQGLYDLRAVDGPAQQLVEKFILGLRIRAIQKAETSQLFRDLDGRLTLDEGLDRLGVTAADRAGVRDSAELKTRAETINEMVDARVQQSIDAFRIAEEMTGEGGDDLWKTIFEAVSQAKGVHNLDDIDQWMRHNLLGGRWRGGRKQTGALIRNFGAMFTHSVLSGPKTVVRAIMGTSTAAFTRPMALAIGASMRGDWRMARQGLASLNAMKETIPEAYELFKTRLNSYWSGELSGPNTRFLEVDKANDRWNMYRHWANSDRANWKDRLVFFMANSARWANDYRWFTYSTKAMQATDDAFGLIIARAKARERALLKAMDDLPDGHFQNFDEALFKKYEDEFQKQIFDEQGNLTDYAAQAAKKEATLTQDLHGFAKHLDHAFKDTPWARPFFLFARTGVNGLNLSFQHMPGLNLFVKETRDILFHPLTANLENLHRYGIRNVADLQQAKDIRMGRMAMGTTIMSMASWAYLSGNLHGNGPTDRKDRQAWRDMGWRPREIKIGNVWVSYDAFEPFNQVLALVGDIGDHMDLMGEEWAEQNFFKLSMAVAGTITSKSYLAGMSQFVDLFSGKPGQQNRIIASLVNNYVPLSSLRNEIGKVLNPYTKELHSSIWNQIRNRNQYITPMPIKYDVLTGEPIKNHNFMTRMWNAVSPVQFNLDYSPGRQMLFNSGFDVKPISYTSPDGLDLSDSPQIRSMFQNAMGQQNLEEIFNRLANNKDIQASIALMNYHNDNGMKWRDPSEYQHYKIIAKEFEKARKKAWASIVNTPEVQLLLEKARERKIENVLANEELYQTIVGIRK